MNLFNRDIEKLELRVDKLEKYTNMNDVFYKDMPINRVIEALLEHLNLNIRYSSPIPPHVVLTPKAKDTFV